MTYRSIFGILQTPTTRIYSSKPKQTSNNMDATLILLIIFFSTFGLLLLWIFVGGILSLVGRCNSRINEWFDLYLEWSINRIPRLIKQYLCNMCSQHPPPAPPRTDSPLQAVRDMYAIKLAQYPATVILVPPRPTTPPHCYSATPSIHHPFGPNPIPIHYPLVLKTTSTTSLNTFGKSQSESLTAVDGHHSMV